MKVNVNTAQLQVALEQIKSKRVTIQTCEIEGGAVIVIFPDDKDEEAHIICGKPSSLGRKPQ